MTKINALITIKSWNRPLYLYQVLCNLLNVRGIENYDIMIFNDLVDLSMRNQIHEAVKISSRQFGSKPINIGFMQEQLGCARNTDVCLRATFKDNKYDYAIHLEDDIIPGENLLEYCEQVSPLLDRDDYFAACFLQRPCHDDHKEYCDKLIKRRYFEVSGGYLMSKKQWEEIEEMGGIFGVNYISDKGRKYDCQGEEWLKEINKSPTGGSGFVFDHYFRKGRYCLYPSVSTIMNIGSVGAHLKDPAVHEQLQKNINWIRHDKWLEYCDKGFEYDTENIETDDRKFVEYGIES